jgi:very-short-patch-repair endonuclease
MPRRDRPPSADWLVARLAARQHGVVTRHQLLSLGISADAIDHRIREGRLHILHRGVYAFGHRHLTTEGRWLAAVFACGPGAVLSHRSAAALWGLRPGWRDVLEVSAARTMVRQPGIALHRPRALDADERTVENGIPVTTVSRTITDCADLVSRAELRKLLEQAEVLRLDATPRVIPGRRGAGRLAAALAELGPVVRLTRSELEDRFLALCRQTGLPLPRTNTLIEGMEVDFCWPERRVAVETDGWEAHGTRTAFRRDRRRSAMLQLAGWTVLRFTYDDVVRDPGYVRTTLAHFLRNPLTNP